MRQSSLNSHVRAKQGTDMSHKIACRFFLACLAFILVTPCHAACEYSEKLEQPIYEAKKRWPMHPETTIHASAIFHQGSDFSLPPEHGMGLFDLFVEIDNSRTKKSSSFCQSSALSSDAITLHGISIDTAPYILSSSTHAFGVRATYSNNSRSNPASIETINLFGVKEGNARQVIGTLYMHGRFHEISLIEDCKGSFNETNRTISISKKMHNGLADLNIIETNSEGIIYPKGTECAEKYSKKNINRYTLYFNGKEYVIPSALKF